MKWLSLLLACLINTFFIVLISLGGPKEARSLSLLENGAHTLMAFNVVRAEKIEKPVDIQESKPLEMIAEPKVVDEKTVITATESDRKIEKTEKTEKIAIEKITKKEIKKLPEPRVMPKTSIAKIEPVQRNNNTQSNRPSKPFINKTGIVNTSYSTGTTSTVSTASTSSASGFANGTNQASLIGRVNQCYPKISQKRGEEGVAEVEVRIGKTNNVISVRLVKSTGFSRLDDCALSAVKSARFKSAINKGVAIESTFKLQPIRFRIVG